MKAQRIRGQKDENRGRWPIVEVLAWKGMVQAYVLQRRDFPRVLLQGGFKPSPS